MVWLLMPKWVFKVNWNTICVRKDSRQPAIGCFASLFETKKDVPPADQQDLKNTERSEPSWDNKPIVYIYMSV